MAGLDPAIHVARPDATWRVARKRRGVDARHKAGHDGWGEAGARKRVHARAPGWAMPLLGPCGVLMKQDSVGRWRRALERRLERRNRDAGRPARSAERALPL